MVRIYKVQDHFPDGKYRHTAPVYGSNQTLMAVSCEENVVPCLQMSVYAAYLGQTLDNLHDRRLMDVPANGEWFTAVCKNRYWLRGQNKQCDACAWFGHCGDCRASGILDAGEETDKFDYSTSAPLSCLFFRGSWYEPVRKLPDTVTSPRLEGELRTAASGVKELFFDLADLEYISSAGPRVLLSAQKVMNKQGKMTIRNVRPETMEIFEITGFADILNIEE